MQEITGDFRESLADAVVGKVEVHDDSRLDVMLTLWNEEPAILSFRNASHFSTDDCSKLEGMVIEYLNEVPAGDVASEDQAAQGKGFAVIDMEGEVVLKLLAGEVKFLTDSPVLHS